MHQTCSWDIATFGNIQPDFMEQAASINTFNIHTFSYRELASTRCKQLNKKLLNRVGIKINCMMYLMQYRTSEGHIASIRNRVHGQQERVASLGH